MLGLEALLVYCYKTVGQLFPDRNKMKTKTSSKFPPWAGGFMYFWKLIFKAPTPGEGAA